MQLFMLKSKIYEARLTGAELHYEGSITLDRNLLEAAEILPGEQVHVLNINNGSRIVTYVIEAEANSGTVFLNGPAARMGTPGDAVIVLAYCAIDRDQVDGFKSRIVKVNNKNQPV